MRKTHGLIHPVFKQVIGSLLSDGVSLLNSSSILIASVAVADRPDSSNVSVCFLMINFNYLKEKGMKKKLTGKRLDWGLRIPWWDRNQLARLSLQPTTERSRPPTQSSNKQQSSFSKSAFKFKLNQKFWERENVKFLPFDWVVQRICDPEWCLNHFILRRDADETKAYNTWWTRLYSCTREQ